MKKILKIFISLSVTFLIFFYILKKVDLAQISQDIQTIKWHYSALAFVLYIIINILRSVRFKLFLGSRMNNLKMFSIVSLQNFFNVILPFRAGELSYVYMIHKSGEASLGKNITSLLGARIFDLLSVIVLFMLPLTFLSQSIKYYLILLTTSLLILVIIILVFIILIIKGDKIVNFLCKWLERKKYTRFVPVGYFMEKLNEVVEGVSILKRRNLLFKIILFSVLIIILTFLSSSLLFRGANLPMNFWQIVFIYTLPLLLSLTPLYGFGGFGGYEGSVVLGLVFFGIGVETAVSSSIILHFQELSFNIILALVGGMGYLKFKNKSNELA